MNKLVIICIIAGIGILAIGFGSAISNIGTPFIVNENNNDSLNSEGGIDGESATIRLSENMDLIGP